MKLPNDIVLRPRFKFVIDIPHHQLMADFNLQKKDQSEFVVSCIDDHVFIKFPKRAQHFWSPQLHLEINENDENSITMRGLFGPNPTVWTLFMFLHFVVAGLFIAFGIWAFTNWTLGSSMVLPSVLMAISVLLWFVLYFVGRLGRSKGEPEMYQLLAFLNQIIDN